MSRLVFAAERGWSAAVDGDRFAAGDDAAAVQAVLDALVSGGFGAAVDALVTHGVAAMPAIVLAETEGDALHVLVRGDATLVVTTSSGEVRLSGSGVTTWSEQVLQGATGFIVEVPGGRWSSDSSRSGSGEVDDSTVFRPLPGLVEDDADDASLPDETLVPDPVTQTATPQAGGDPIGDVPQVDPPTMPIPAAAIGQVPSPSASAPAAVDGDHDGQTIVSDSIRALLAERDRSAAAGEAASAPQDEPRSAAMSPTASAAQLELADGTREALERPIIVGRAPSAAKVSGSTVPKLLKVGGEDPDISRTHARIALEGGTVVVTDLHSRNGTIVVLPGKAAQRLRAGEPTAVLDGTVVDLGGGVTMTVRAG